MAAFILVPISLEDANEYVAQKHRHLKAVRGHKFSLAALQDLDGIAIGLIVGVAIIGRPVARSRDDGLTLEVTRLATDGTRNACSFLYGAAARAAFALGYKRIGTYIRADEPGASLVACSWRQVGEVYGRSWNCESRPRVDKHEIIPRLLFEKSAAGQT